MPPSPCRPLQASLKRSAATLKRLQASLKRSAATLKRLQASPKRSAATLKRLQASLKRLQASLKRLQASLKRSVATLKRLQASLKRSAATLIVERADVAMLRPPQDGALGAELLHRDAPAGAQILVGLGDASGWWIRRRWRRRRPMGSR